jgi:hypothetical protein
MFEESQQQNEYCNLLKADCIGREGNLTWHKKSFIMYFPFMTITIGGKTSLKLFDVSAGHKLFSSFDLTHCSL